MFDAKFVRDPIWQSKYLWCVVSFSCFNTILSLWLNFLLELDIIYKWPYLKVFHKVKIFKCDNFFGPYFPKFGLNTGEYGPEKATYLETFHTNFFLLKLKANIKSIKSQILEATKDTWLYKYRTLVRSIKLLLIIEVAVVTLVVKAGVMEDFVLLLLLPLFSSWKKNLFQSYYYLCKFSPVQLS